MFTRSSSRIAHLSDSSSEGGAPSPCRLPSSSIKPPTTFPLRRKFHLNILRFRISSLLRLLRSMSSSVRRALHTLLMPKKRSPPPSKSRMVMPFSAQCTRSACAPDAIADCIEFIKRSSSSSSPSSSSPPSQPSSPSLSSPFSPPLFSPSFQYSSLSHSSQFPLSRLHHGNSLP